MNDYSKLKSGTDIRGVAIASENKSAVLTETAVSDFANAFALWIAKRTGKQRFKIAVGRDSRLTGELFTRVVISSLKYAGLEIFDCGMFSTPAAFLTTQFPSMQTDGAIMITASHHPKDINGLKFFTPEGGVNSGELNEIIEIASEGKKMPMGPASTIVRRDFMRLYCDSLTDALRKGTGLFLPLKGLNIVVDAGHGAGGFFATRVLEPLGADTSASQFLEPDGSFPAHAPNPENGEAMQSLKDRVIETGADLGIIFDADVDRCAIVTSDGMEINRCRLIALAAAMILPDHPNATIVTDSVTTEGLKQFIESRGGVQKRFKRGYRNVIDEAKRLCESGVDAPLAIESSGHVAFSEHYFLDDGAYFITKILIAYANLRKQGQSITDLIADYSDPLEECDIRLNFMCENWRELADKIMSRLNGLAERLLRISPGSYEGVRAYVSHANGYFIVRTSVHDPVLPIYIESNKAGGVKSIARFLYSFLKDFGGLDCTPFDEYVQEESKPDETAYEDSAAEQTEEVPDNYAVEEQAEESFEEYAADSDGGFSEYDAQSDTVQNQDEQTVQVENDGF
ncbi:MAG: phosphomannomutase/phosphoglucomutase [Clostridiales bacterium]|nr:phosphomannomutase/phosphoglucomutase [Clostridiales bacterium]